MLEFRHNFYLFEGLINFKWIEMDFFEGIFFTFLISDEVDGAEASLP